MVKSVRARSIGALLVSTLLLLMLPGLVAGASGDKAKRIACIREAEQAMGVDLHHSQFDDIILGTNGDDTWAANQAGPTLFCGFGGNDTITAVITDGDIFVGGPGKDQASNLQGATFVGGSGGDKAHMIGGLFLGGRGDDVAMGHVDGGAKFVGGPGDDGSGPLLGGSIFKGGPGDDDASDIGHPASRFYGKRGHDRVSQYLCEGRFIGGPGRDSVNEMAGGSFHGKKGLDRIDTYESGRYWSVEDVTAGIVTFC